MNPFRWTLTHQIAWLVVSLVGALLGVMLAFIHSDGFELAGPSQPLQPWLAHPESYEGWALACFFITAMLFYGAQLFRQSN
jgi:predicted branched-subunit amino acid permease